MLQEECESTLLALREELEGMPIVIDAVSVCCPLGLARFLLEHGFGVAAVCTDIIFEYEKEDADFLEAQYPSFRVLPTVLPELRRKAVRQEICDGVTNPENKILAIGPKAAWFFDTPYFVNMIENGGLYGYRGILELAREMREAMRTEKDLRDIVPRKGLGCSCVIE